MRYRTRGSMRWANISPSATNHSLKISALLTWYKQKQMANPIFTMTALGFIGHKYLLILVTVKFYWLFLLVCICGVKSPTVDSKLIKRNQLSCKRMFLTARVVAICYVDTLLFLKEHNGIYDLFFVKSRCLGINFHNPWSSTYTEVLFFSVLYYKDIPNISAVRK